MIYHLNKYIQFKYRAIMLRLPDWIGIGCVKCGTSWVWREIKKHPQIFTPDRKEIHFFNGGSEKSLRWYANLFTQSSPDQKVGEFTPDYYHHYEAMHRIKEKVPHANLITLFRHPVERAFSNWKHAVQEKRFEGTFEESFDFWRVRERGIYSRWLTRWWSLFPKEQLKIMWYEDIAKEPVKFLQEIYRHIGVDDTFVPEGHEKQFQFHYHGNEELANAEITGRQRWLDYYLPYTEALEKQTGRDLSLWKC